MATKKCTFSKTQIAELPNDKSILFRIETKTGTLNYLGVAARGKVIEQLTELHSQVPGATLKIEQFDSIKDARSKQANIIKRSGQPKYNT